MTTARLVTLDRDGNVATLTLNRPESLNALTREMLDQACMAAREVAASDARVLILTGAGRAFCAGVDLKIARDRSYDAAARAAFTHSALAFQHLVETMPQPVIAKIRGACVAGGLELALSADCVIAATDARFSDTHAKFGFIPEWGMPSRLAQLVGRMRANDIAFTARVVDGIEAAAIGLVLEAVAPDLLDQRVTAFAAMIAANDPRSIANYKTNIRQSVGDRVGI